VELAEGDGMGLICGAASAGALLLSPRQARISYAVTVCDEVEEIRRLIDILGGIDIRDEIVIQYDEPKTPPAMMDYLQALRGARNCGAIVPFALNDDFAAFKNNVKKFCRGDYIFQIDADEYPSAQMLSQIHAILSANAAADVLMVPRINTVSGLTQAHLHKWGWQINAQGWVNFPDPQARIYRNSDSIRWVNRVHETLAGYKILAQVPWVPELALMHPKTIARQERQNSFYERLAKLG